MLHKLFHWFYCLDLLDAAVLVAVCAMVYLLATEAVRNRWVKNSVHLLLLTVWMAVVLYMTIGMREGSNTRKLTLIPFYSYYVLFHGGSREIIRTNLMNVLLFVPGGLFTGCLLPERWKVWSRLSIIVLLFAAVSIGIEWAQYYFSLGTSEMDDVIHNAFGALIGALGPVTLQQWIKEIRQD